MNLVFFSRMTGRIKPKNDIDLTEEIQFVLRCGEALNGRFGLNAIIDFICGSDKNKLKSMLTHPLFGKGKNHQESFWKALSKKYLTLCIN